MDGVVDAVPLGRANARFSGPIWGPFSRTLQELDMDTFQYGTLQNGVM